MTRWDDPDDSMLQEAVEAEAAPLVRRRAQLLYTVAPDRAWTKDGLNLNADVGLFRFLLEGEVKSKEIIGFVESLAIELGWQGEAQDDALRDACDRVRDMIYRHFGFAAP